MKLSIIISTYNNAQSLVRTLVSVAEQEADKSMWECVVVNNASTDNTEALFQEFASEHQELNLRLVNEPKQGLSYARNCGIAESKGDILVFIDDDETVNREFVSAYIDIFDNHGAFVGAGAVVPRYDSARPKWMSYYTEKMIANPINLGNEVVTITSKITPAGGNMAFNREIFNLYGGFNTALGRKGEALLGGEENDMFDRVRSLGERVFYAPNAVVYHHIADKKLTPDYFDKLAYGVGVSKRLRAEHNGTERQLFKDENKKRLYTIVLVALYSLAFQFQKASWLWRMRKGIAKGIFSE